MITNTLDILKRKLRPLSLYSLSEDSLIHAELAAYAVGLDLLLYKLHELERECFISTAETYGLNLRERVFGSVRSELLIQSRRDMLIYRGAITANDFNRDSTGRALMAAGINGYIVEDPSKNEIHINCMELVDTTLSVEQIKEQSQKFLPAHLVVNFDFGKLTWDYIDGKDLAFSEIDTCDLTWSEIDD